MTELEDAAGGEIGAELDGFGAVDFSVSGLEDTVGLVETDAGDELAPPPLPLPEHLPPDDNLTSTQSFWPSTGLE